MTVDLHIKAVRDFNTVGVVSQNGTSLPSILLTCSVLI